MYVYIWYSKGCVSELHEFRKGRENYEGNSKKSSKLRVPLSEILNTPLILPNILWNVERGKIMFIKAKFRMRLIFAKFKFFYAVLVASLSILILFGAPSLVELLYTPLILNLSTYWRKREDSRIHNEAMAAPPSHPSPRFFKPKRCSGILACRAFLAIFHGSNHGTYIRWWLRNRCARKEQSLLFNLFQAFD